MAARDFPRRIGLGRFRGCGRFTFPAFYRKKFQKVKPCIDPHLRKKGGLSWWEAREKAHKRVGAGRLLSILAEKKES